MDSYMMLALGDYRFGMSTAAYQTLERTHRWRWEAITRLGAYPALQFIGAGEQNVTLDGVIYPAFRGGLGQLDAMRREADKATPLHLVDGAGRVWGDFVVTELRETQSVFFSNGAPRRIEFSLSLTAYFDPESPFYGDLNLPDISTLPTRRLGDVLATD